MFGYSRWFGLKPTPVVRLQYVTPWKKVVTGVLLFLLFGFTCFVLGSVWEPRTVRVTRVLELPPQRVVAVVDQPTEPVNANGDFNFVPVALTETDEEYYIKQQLQTEHNWNPTPETMEAEIRCLAQNIYFEARSESQKGKIAVGLVTLNRVKSSRFPDTICGVVWQKRRSSTTDRWVAQFSWTWDGKGDKPRELEVYEEAQRLASAMIAESSLNNFVDFTHGSTHYHADYVNPYWGREFLEAGYRVQQIDTHLFYTRVNLDHL